MAIKIYGDKIVFPDNTEQTTASDSADTSYTKAEIDAQQDAQDVKIDKNTSDLTNVYTKTEVDDSQSAQDTEIAKKLSDAPEDGETYARNNKTWVSIAGSSGIPDAPVDGLMYGRKDGEWDTVADAGDVYTKTETNDLLDEKADKSTTYTKTEVDNSQDAQDVEIAKKANTADTYTKTQTDTLLDSKANVGDSYTKAETYNNTEIDSKLFEKADKTTTYTKDEVDASQDAQDVNISGNTSAIGTLSGRVSANEADIATLQDGIFFSSSYTAEYPDNPNRDPQTGNMYMQDLSAFTYSYADTNQVFLSKTDEQGNVRQFTAVKPDDTIVLNQVESPNYGRYKVVSVNDVGTYVSIVVVFQIGEGTLLEGDTVALQAFPASAGGGGDSIWSEVDDVAVYDGDIKVNGMSVGVGKDPSNLNTVVGLDAFKSDTTGLYNVAVGREALKFNTEGSANVGVGVNALSSNTTGSDNVAIGNSSQKNNNNDRNTTVGVKALTTATDAIQNSALGYGALQVTTGDNNTAVGFNSLVNNQDGNNHTAVGIHTLKDLLYGEGNTAIGKEAGITLKQGNNNTCIGSNSQPSSEFANNEVTIGNDDVEVTRLKGEVQTTQDITVNGVTVGKGSETGANNTALGVKALDVNTGANNTAVGSSALSKNTLGNNCTAVGENSLGNNTEGSNNVCLGGNSGSENTTGIDNVAIGANSLKNNLVGYSNVAVGRDSLDENSDGYENVGVGFDALGHTISGNRNTALGSIALANNIDGLQNSGIGYKSLSQLTSGNGNTGLGNDSGNTLTSGNNNTIIGHNAQPSSPDVSNEVTIGNADVTTLRMGNGDVIYPASGGSGGAGSIKSWVKFNGTGTVTMNGQSGISSVTDEGVGMYRVNFASAMPNANYAMNYGGSRVATNISSSTAVQTFCYDPTASNMKVATFTLSGSLKDHEIICVSIIN